MEAVVVRGRQYLVLKWCGQWFAKSLRRFGEPYWSEVRAVRDAVNRAEKCGQNGEPGMVAVFIKHCEPKIIWTFAQDPYPPITFDFALPPVRSALS